MLILCEKKGTVPFSAPPNKNNRPLPLQGRGLLFFLVIVGNLAYNSASLYN